MGTQLDGISVLDLVHEFDIDALYGADRKDLAIPAYGSMSAFNFDDDNPPASEISFHDLLSDHAASQQGYTETTSNLAFPPHTTNAAIAEHYGHSFRIPQCLSLSQVQPLRLRRTDCRAVAVEGTVIP